MTSLPITHRVRPQFIICLLLTVGTLLLYYPVGQFEFINYDDPGYITDNQWVKSGLNTGSIKWAFQTFHLANWHPMTWLSHMLDVTLYGITPGAHHITNLQFHILNSVLLFLLLHRITGNLWPSALVAAWFAIHPVHIESVAWVSERKDVLSTFCGLLSFWYYSKFIEKPTLVNYLLIMGWFILSLMSKPMLVTLPCIMILLDFWPFDRVKNYNGLSLRSVRYKKSRLFNLFILIFEKLPFFIISGISSVITFYAQKIGGAVSTFDTLPLYVRLANSFVSYILYIMKILAPFNLAMPYPYPEYIPFWKSFGSFLILLITTTIILKLKKYPFLSVGWFWFIGTLIPVIGIVQVGVQSMADRYTYIPSIGIFIIVAWGLTVIKLWCTCYVKISVIFGILSIIFLSIVSTYQLQHWQNKKSLFMHAIKVTKRNYVGSTNLGLAFLEIDEIDEAQKYFNMSLKFKSTDKTARAGICEVKKKFNKTQDVIDCYKIILNKWPNYALIHYNLATIYLNENSIPEAIRHFEIASLYEPDRAGIYSNWAVALGKIGQYNESIQLLKKSIDLYPDYASAHLNLGIALMQTDKLSQAIQHFSRSLELQPYDQKSLRYLRSALKEKKYQNDTIKKLKSQIQENPSDFEAQLNLGLMYKRIGEVQNAIAHFEKSLDINPNLSPALHNLSIIHATKGQYDQALELLNRMTIADPNNPMGYYYAAGIYARKNQVESAVEWLKKAVDKGFSDTALLKNDSNMKNIRETAYYQELVAGSDNL